MHPRPSTPRVTTGIHQLTSERFERPLIDDGGLLWYGDRWVAVTELQTPVVELLLRNLDQVVARAEIVETYAAAGGSTRDEAILSVMRRIANHFTEVGARVRFAYRAQAMVVSLPSMGPA